MIRHAKNQDIPQLAQLEQYSNPSAWSKKQLTASFLNPHVNTWVWEQEKNQITSMLMAQFLFDEVEILLLSSHPHHRRQGHASCLLQALLFQAQQHKMTRILLEVRESNQVAISLYEKQGFFIINKRANYYQSQQNSENAIIMEYTC